MQKRRLFVVGFLLTATLTVCACGKKQVEVDDNVSISKVEIDVDDREKETETSVSVSSVEDKTSVTSASEAAKTDDKKEDNVKEDENSKDETNIKDDGAGSEKEDSALKDDKKKVDYQSIYKKILDRTYEILIEEDYWDYVREGETGIVESRHYLDNPLGSIGYVYKDLNHDDVPELMITCDCQTYDEVFALYTIEDGNAVLVFEGWARSAYFYGEKETFVYSGSAGAAYSAYGTFKLTDDAKSLVCNDFYFSDIDDKNDIYYFHNSDGLWDSAKSEKLSDSEDEFWEREKQIFDTRVKLDTTPMAIYGADIKSQKADSNVIIAWAKDVLTDASSFDDIIIDKNEYSSKVVFSTKSVAKDFKILALTMDISKDEKITYSFEEVYSKEELNKEKLVAVSLAFPGDMPNYAFSYIDDQGQEKIFAIQVSGKDGTLDIFEIVPEEE